MTMTTYTTVGELRRLMEGITDECATTPIAVNFLLDLENGSRLIIEPAYRDTAGALDWDAPDSGSREMTDDEVRSAWRDGRLVSSHDLDSGRSGDSPMSCPDVSGADIGQRRRRGVLTVSADLDREHLLAELKGAVEEIGHLKDDIDDLHAQIACLEEEIDEFERTRT